jgi:hypothetical protein
VLAAFGKAPLLIVLPLSVSAIVGSYLSFSPNSDGLRLIGFVVCAVWAIAIVSMAVKAAWRALAQMPWADSNFGCRFANERRALALGW